MQVVITAGGLATRLGTLTAGRPKVLLPVAGRPFLDLVLALLAGAGVSHAHLCLGRHADQVLAYLRGRAGPPIVTSSVETVPLGTAGCLRLALPHLRDRFLLLHGDTYTPVPFAPIAAAHRAGGQPALMAVLRNEDRWERSNVRVRDGLVVEYDKQAPPGRYRHVDYGIAGLTRALVQSIPAERQVDLTEVLGPLVTQRRLAAYEVSTRFYEIGSHTGYAEFEALVRAGTLPGAAPARATG
jgi:NDP-sugar pyrophosphorylase family protein